LRPDYSRIERLPVHEDSTLGTPIPQGVNTVLGEKSRG